MKRNYIIASLLLCFAAGSAAIAQSLAGARQAAKPLYRDPIYDGAADPVITWNPHDKKWWMFYTNRRATIHDTGGVQWVHGTRIGIATSPDGAVWTYKDTASINYHPDSAYTFWAPDIIEHKGVYHMFLTYVPGVFSNWNHPRDIIHCTSTDLLHWKYESTLELANHKVIDASIFQLPDGGWRLWYNNETDGKSIYYADSKDLVHFTDKGKAIAAHGEGPKVFKWKDKYWMIVDVWKGMDIYSSSDLLNWTRQPNRILEAPGKGIDDQAIGGHCDVVVSNDQPYVFYFTHPGRRKDKPAPRGSIDERRSLIQVAALHYKDGAPWCDRDEPVFLKLKP